ncbi:MAG: lipopolysaccharide heptosyltransferase II [Candidatus Omnitrophica bacterium]|nr:lipopolysaccharide heptosyltransferase II [Candidatus Omnitrophota bacterium]
MKKILVINVNWLGDVVFSTPVLKALREANEVAHIACLVISRCEEVLKNNPHINEIIVYDEYGKHQTILAKIKFIRYLRKKRFDEAYVLHPSLRRAMIGFLASIPSRTGYNTKNRSFLLTRSIPAPDKLMHKIDYFLNILKSCGIKAQDRNCEFFINNTDKQEAQQILKENGIAEREKYVVINPGGNWMMKRWPSENFAKLGDMLAQINKLKVVITGAKKDRGLAARIESMMKTKPVRITGSTTLHQLAAIMKASDCVVSADSGPMHISVAVGANTVAIFGPTSSDLTGPVGAGKTVILQKDVGCEIPCYVQGCTDNRCMYQITPYEVYEQVVKML